MSEALKILIYLPAHVKSNRDLLRGFLRYASTTGRWTCEIVGISENYENVDELRLIGRPDGVVCYSDDTRTARNLLSLRVPLIEVLPDVPKRLRKPQGRRAQVVCDSARIGAAAADYLASLAPASYAFAGRLPSTTWSRQRRRAFTAALGNAPVELLGVGRRGDLTTLAHKLSLLPRPVALFAENDRLARAVLSACTQLSLAVPEDVMILGVDDDEILCETVTPSLTSIRMDARDCGTRAAEALDRLLQGVRLEVPTLSYTFSQVVERFSTRVNYATGTLSEKARRFIAHRLEREKEDGPLHVDALAQQLGCSRRTLEMAFRKETGRTVHGEILRQRVRKALKLLATESYSLDAIATACGFASASHLGKVFRAQFGKSPSSFRPKP